MVLLAVLPGRASSQVPVLGRWQDFAYSEEVVDDAAAAAYFSRLATLESHGLLDDDAQVLERVRRLGPPLIREASQLKPAARLWNWELHTTSAADETAFSMAGGKLLFSSSFIRRLELADGELATLMAHEIAHAIAEHQREAYSQVFFRNRARTPLSVSTAMASLDTNWSLQIELARLSRLQESEADQLGMTLAHSAGWDTAGMVSFYRKLIAEEGESVLGWGYPAARARVRMAEIFAIWFPGSANISAPGHDGTG
jgi:predicted Zn-dependent protease